MLRLIHTLLFGVISIGGMFVSGSAKADLVGADGKPLVAHLADRLEVARAELKTGNIEACRTKIVEIVAGEENCMHADVILADWLSGAGNSQLAAQLLEEASKVDGDRPDVHLAYALILAKQGLLFGASTHLNAAAIAERPGNWDDRFYEQFQSQVRVNQAQIAERRGKWSDAQALWAEQNEKESSPAVQLGLARSSFALGEVAQAETHLRQAAEMNDSIIPQLLLAELYIVKKDPEQVAICFERALQEAPDSKEQIVLQKAKWLLNENRFAEVLDALQISLPTGSEQRPEDQLRALALYAVGNFEEAASVLSALSQSGSSDVSISNQLALALVESSDEGKRGRAMQIATSNLNANPTSAELASTFAWVQYRLGDLVGAERTCIAILNQGGTLSRDSAYFVSEVLSKTQRPDADRIRKLALESQGLFLSIARTE